MPGYKYPTSEEVTDVTELMLDPNKLAREQYMISAAMAFEWHHSLDFGCGSGRYLPILLESSKSKNARTLIAYDIDKSRIAKARDAYSDLEGLLFIDGEIDRLSNIIDDKSLDAVLCCQVLGHVSPNTFNRVFDLFKCKMASRGKLIVCVPYYASYESEAYFHTINTLSLYNSNKVKREQVSSSEFAAAADNPAYGVLPVRAFGIPQVPIFTDNSCLPISCAVPAPFDKLAEWDIISAMIYSIHERINGAQSNAIGDIIIKLQRK